MKISELRHISQNCHVMKDGEFDILGLVGKEYPAESKVLSFLGNDKFIEQFLANNTSGVICTDDIAKKICEVYMGGICVCENPKKLFFQFHNHLANTTDFYGGKLPTSIDASSTIHSSAIIAKHNVFIGKNVYIGAHVVIHTGSIIHDNVIIRDSSIIGTPAFYYYGEDDSKHLVESVGKVILENNVELHSNVVVEKGVLGGSTVIGQNTKIDNMILIGHDSHIGRNCTIAAGTSLAGGVYIGDGSFVGLAAAFSPNVRVGCNVKVSIGAVVTKDVPDNTQVSGNFAIDHGQFLTNLKKSLKNTEK